MLVRAAVGRNGVEDVSFRFVRHNDANETYLCGLDKEADALADLARRSAGLGATLTRAGDEVHVDLPASR
jgi:hypothetical protein